MKSTRIYEPIKEQFLMLIEYINILELRTNVDHRQEIMLLIEMMEHAKRHAEIYLNYTFLTAGQEND